MPLPEPASRKSDSTPLQNLVGIFGYKILPPYSPVWSRSLGDIFFHRPFEHWIDADCRSANAGLF